MFIYSFNHFEQEIILEKNDPDEMLGLTLYYNIGPSSPPQPLSSPGGKDETPNTPSAGVTDHPSEGPDSEESVPPANGAPVPPLTEGEGEKATADSGAVRRGGEVT